MQHTTALNQLNDVVQQKINVVLVTAKLSDNFVTKIQNESSVLESQKFEILRRDKFDPQELQQAENRYRMKLEDVKGSLVRIDEYKSTLIESEGHIKRLRAELEKCKRAYGQSIEQAKEASELLMKNEQELRIVAEKTCSLHQDTSNTLDSIHW